ncbi:MAG: class I SAM-dependent methyltransferase [Candidatus Sumerlaeaceae bacterium]|nr:class I SAM-dependent methyltransferase [Candidatus Sumerlaeaceae bacterium]
MRTAGADAQSEIERGERFAFGRNWSRFLDTLDESRMIEAERSIQSLLRCETLSGRTFLDIGSGSGLFSLAARRLGARVFSFDYDRESVACALELRRRYFPNDPDWVIAHGSILDPAFLAQVTPADVVYSWGVLHHTGQMWTALENAGKLVLPGGLLAVSIYNDQAGTSRRWRAIKRAYVASSAPVRWLLLAISLVVTWWKDILADFVRMRPFYTWRTYSRQRGMSPWHDLVDWVGGYPFEVAKPEEIFEFFTARGFTLIRLKTCGGGKGCNEYVFRRDSSPALPLA